jgi:hypothetical protein
VQVLCNRGPYNSIAPGPLNPTVGTVFPYSLVIRTWTHSLRNIPYKIEHVPVYMLKAKQWYTVTEILISAGMKLRNKKLRYTGMYRPISSTGFNLRPISRGWQDEKFYQYRRCHVICNSLFPLLVYFVSDFKIISVDFQFCWHFRCFGDYQQHCSCGKCRPTL